MGVNGYSDRLIAIDDEMVALGRPVPPVVSWIRGAIPMGKDHKRNEPATCPCGWCKATRAWRTQLEKWEETNPDGAIRWHELDAQYAAQEEVERRAKFDGSDDAWNYVLLEDIGVPRTNLDLVRGTFSDNSTMRAANEWLRDGTVWSVTLVGGTGCGKSTAAAWAAHQMLMRRFRPVWVDCVKQCEAPMYGVAAEHQRWRCREAQVLVLDDLGSGRRERESQFWLAWLDDVIGSRANNAKKTIVTTNRSPDELKAWLGDRLADRLRSGALHVSVEKSMRGAP